MCPHTTLSSTRTHIYEQYEVVSVVRGHIYTVQYEDTYTVTYILTVCKQDGSTRATEPPVRDAPSASEAVENIFFDAVVAQAYCCICVLILLYMCPHTTIYVSSCYNKCALILLYECSQTTVYVSSDYYIFCDALAAEVSRCLFKRMCFICP